jgi:translation initiation factor 2 alpha subunit (eIF-2alpha)
MVTKSARQSQCMFLDKHIDHTKESVEISLDEVRQHDQEYQNEARRNAQNTEQLITCLKGSITKHVHTRIYQLRNKYLITREPEKEVVQDGFCYHKVIINCYYHYCHTR